MCAALYEDSGAVAIGLVWLYWVRVRVISVY